MPSLGYVRGNVWKTDPLGVSFLRLECAQRLHRAAGKRGFSSDAKYSFTGRQYVAEVFTTMTFEKSAKKYLVSAALKHGATPLEAEMAAYRDCVPLDAEMAMCYLECEMYLLERAVKVIGPLERALADLSEVTSMINIDTYSRGMIPEKTWDEVFADKIKTEHGTYVTKPLTYDEDDDL